MFGFSNLKENFFFLDCIFFNKKLKLYLIFFVFFIEMFDLVYSCYSSGNGREDNFFMMFVCEGRLCFGSWSENYVGEYY